MTFDLDLTRLLDTRPASSSDSEGPHDYDPEDADFGNTVDRTRAGSKRVPEDSRSHYREALPRTKRLALPIDDSSFLNGRYAGVKTTRSSLGLGPAAPEAEEKEESFSEGEERFDYEAPEARLREQLQDYREAEEMQLEMVARRATDDVERGRHVKQQLEKWQSALDLRVRLQPLLTMVNKLPVSSHLHALREHLNTEMQQTEKDLSILTETLSAQLTDDADNGEIRLARLDKEMAPIWQASLDKWHQKVALSTEGSSRRQLKVINASLWSQVETAMRDRSRLVRRATTRRGEMPLFGPDAPVFDDGDFFSTLVRTWVGEEACMAGLVVKKVKTSKMVDTRASKGRKMRYDVHDKLVNYMVPVSDPALWGDAKIDAFFASIFPEQ